MKLKNKLFAFSGIGLTIPLVTFPMLSMTSCSGKKCAATLSDEEWKSINQKELNSINFSVVYKYEIVGSRFRNKKLEDYPNLIDYAINFHLKEHFDTWKIKKVPNRLYFGDDRIIDPEHETKDNNVKSNFFRLRFEISMCMDYYGMYPDIDPVNYKLFYDLNSYDKNGNYIVGSNLVYWPWNYQFNHPYANKILTYDKYVMVDENSDGNYDKILINELTLTSGEWSNNMFFEKITTKVTRNNVLVYAFKKNAWTKDPNWACKGIDNWPVH